MLQSSVKRVRVGGVLVDVLSRAEWAARLSAIEPGPIPRVCFYANGQTIVAYAFDPAFRALVNQADAISADSQPLVWASRMTSAPIPERAAWTDAFHDAAAAAEQSGARFFFLGAAQGQLAAALEAIRRRYPALNVVGFSHGYFTALEEPALIERISAARPDVLWVGLGAPLQERFIIRHRHALRGISWIVACGGLFDHLSPDSRRAPAWMRAAGLEWLHRALQRPSKYLARYAATNGPAAWLLLTRTERAAAPRARRTVKARRRGAEAQAPSIVRNRTGATGLDT